MKTLELLFLPGQDLEQARITTLQVDGPDSAFVLSAKDNGGEGDFAGIIIYFHFEDRDSAEILHSDRKNHCCHFAATNTLVTLYKAASTTLAWSAEQYSVRTTRKYISP